MFRIDRRVLLILGAASVLLVVILLSIITKEANRSLNVSSAFAANINFPHQIDNNTLYFFSGSSFTSYDLKSHQTKALTPTYSLPTDITEVVWSKQGALINASGYSTVDQLFPTLVRQNLRRDVYYWWLVDFKTGAINPVGNISTGANVHSPVWQADGTFLYAEKIPGHADLVVMRGAIGQQPLQLAAIPEDSVIVTANSDSFLFMKPAGNETFDLMSMKLSAKSATKLADKVLSVLGTGPDGSALLITQAKKAYDPQDTRGNLVIYNESTGKAKTLSSDFRGTGYWDKATDEWSVLGYDINNKSIGFMSEGEKIVKISLALPDSSTEKYTIVGQNDSGLLLANIAQQLSYASESLPNNLPGIASYSSLKDGYYADQFYIAYIKTEDQYSIYITQNPYQANVQAALKYLKDSGLDPNQMKLKFYAYDKVTPDFALPANQVPSDPPAPNDTSRYFDDGE